MADVDVDATASAHALELRRVVKSFGPVVALRSGSLTLDRGSIHALIGENGAGKSTLVKVIAGLYRRDSGEFLLDGEPVDFSSTAQSKAAGIAVIYQEPTLFPDLSVTENIFMGRQPHQSLRPHRPPRDARRGDPDLHPARSRAGPRAHHRGSLHRRPADHRDRQGHLARRTGAHHGRADGRAVGVEVERLFAVARSLRDEGRALLFISHRFDEVFALCDTVTVMRDGSYVDTTPIAETSVDELVRQMVGRDVTDLFPKLPAEVGDVVLEVDGLTRVGVFRDITFTLRAGEIVGLAGLVGAGRSEVARAVFGVDPYESGSVRLHGKPLPQGKSARRDRPWARARARGPPQAGTRARRERHPQRHPRDPQQAGEVGPALGRGREPRALRSGRAGSR